MRKGLLVLLLAAGLVAGPVLAAGEKGDVFKDGRSPLRCCRRRSDRRSS